MIEASVYEDCLKTAAKQLYEGRKIHQYILEKAIGKPPKTSDSPDSDTFMESYKEKVEYLEKEKVFIEKATNLSKTTSKGA